MVLAVGELEAQVSAGQEGGVLVDAEDGAVQRRPHARPCPRVGGVVLGQHHGQDDVVVVLPLAAAVVLLPVVVAVVGGLGHAGLGAAEEQEEAEEEEEMGEEQWESPSFRAGGQTHGSTAGAPGVSGINYSGGLTRKKKSIDIHK